MLISIWKVRYQCRKCRQLVVILSGEQKEVQKWRGKRALKDGKGDLVAQISSVIIPCRFQTIQDNPKDNEISLTPIKWSFHIIIMFQSLAEPPVQEQHIYLSVTVRNPHQQPYRTF